MDGSAVEMLVEVPTTSQVNKAGRTLRGAGRGEDVADADYDHAIDVLLAFRADHAAPLKKANMGLRSMVSTAGCDVEISQRLKRVPTILDKLVREPTLQLANMQDLGGVRSVLKSIEEIRRVEKRVRKYRPPVRVSDYINHPRPSGYRGLHLIVVYHGRRIEIQLRTWTMHEWAFSVERLMGRIGTDLKSGKGPEEVHAWLGAISEAMALEERGETVDSALMERVARLRAAAVPYLGGPR